MAGARTVTDDELLGGGDDDPGAGLDALDAADDNGEDTFGATPVAAAVEDPGEGVEFQIVDGDEQARRADDDQGTIDAKPGIDGDDFDTGDAGEEVDDFLTAEEKKNYSATMQKRIMRERRLKAESDATAARESAARASAEEKLAAAQTQLTEQRKVTAGVLLSSLDMQITAKTAALKVAKDGTDTDVELKLQGELDDLRAQRRDVDAAKRQLDATPVVEAKAAEAAPAANPAADRWKARNPWMQNKEFAADINQAFFFDRQIAAEGKHAKNSPGYFAELDRRLNLDRPGLRAKVQRAYGGAAAQKPKEAGVAPVSRAGTTVRAAAAGKPGKIVLTKGDLENMQAFGMKTDPKTAEGRRDMLAYAREKGRSNAQNQ